MGIGRKYREELLEKKHNEKMERIRHSDMPEFVYDFYDSTTVMNESVEVPTMSKGILVPFIDEFDRDTDSLNGCLPMFIMILGILVMIGLSIIAAIYL